jgi:hypothetical protein
MVTKEVHIPFLSEDEKLFLNTTATFSQARRMSNTLDSCHSVRPSLEDNQRQKNRHQIVSSTNSLSTFLWKRRGSSTSSLASSSSSLDLISEHKTDQQVVTPTTPKSPKARELESLIFDQPQRTVRLSLTPRCAF